jgi:hypothetical protein
MALGVGVRIGAYEIVFAMGDGAMASVPHALFNVSGRTGGQKFLAAIQPTAEVSNPLSIVLNWWDRLTR